MVKINIPTEVENIISGLMSEGYDAYAVGGCVRDSIIGEIPNDWDICTSATTDEMKKHFEKCKMKTVDTGIRHGTVTVIGENGGTYEVTTFRVDGEYTDNRHPDSVRFVKTVEEDLSRRDFTVNAMAYNSDGLVDPFGGQEDLANGLIRCVGDPNLRFNEDALRILRALRFAAVYDFKIDKNTEEAIHKFKDKLKNISGERLREELCKFICGDGAMRLLLEYEDVIGEIVPELFARTVGYKKAANSISEYDGFELSVKIALLLSEIEPGENNSVISSILDRLKFSTKIKNEITELIANKDREIKETIPTVLQLLREFGEEGTRRLVLFQFARDKVVSSRCKAGGHFTRVGNLMWEALTKNYCYTLKDLALSGEELIAAGIKSGVVIGRVLDHLLDTVISGELQNRRELLLAEAVSYAKTISE